MHKLPHKLPHTLRTKCTRSMHKLLPPYVVGGAVCADCACSLGQLDPDSPIWLAMVAAYLRPNPDAPLERAGHAAARGLLDLMARSRSGERHSATASPGRATPSTPIEEA